MLGRFTKTALATALCSVLLVTGCGELPGSDSDGSADSSSSNSSDTDKKSKRKDKLSRLAAEGERVAKNSLGPQIKKIYKSIRIKPVPPSGLRYVFVFKQPVDVAKARPALKKQVPVLRASFKTQVAPSMRKAGFKSPKATWVYKNPDGETVFSKSFP